MEREEKLLEVLKRLNDPIYLDRYNKILEIIEYVKHAFKDIRLKGIDLPYTEHLFDVALCVIATMGFNYAAVAAALLHDILEDTDITEAVLRAKYGDEITDLVCGLTDISIQEEHRHKPRKERKELDLQHTLQQSDLCIEIKLADTISNLYYCSFHSGDFYRKIYLPEMKTRLDAIANKPGFTEKLSFRVALNRLDYAETRCKLAVL